MPRSGQWQQDTQEMIRSLPTSVRFVPGWDQVAKNAERHASPLVLVQKDELEESLLAGWLAGFLFLVLHCRLVVEERLVPACQPVEKGRGRDHW